MAMKEQPRIVHKSMLGKEVDMHKLTMQNEMTPAVGNIKVNARGDELGPGGTVLRKREEVLRQAASGAPAQRNVRTPSTVEREELDEVDEFDDIEDSEEE